MATQYRITTNGKRYRVERFTPGINQWESTASGTWDSLESAQHVLDRLQDADGEWVPVESAETVQS